MDARWLALGLSLFATAAVAAPAAKDAPVEKPAPVAENSGDAKGGKSSPAEKSATKKSGKDKADKSAKDKAGKALAKHTPDEPKITTVEKLPGALKTVHVCAMPNAKVEYDSERYAKSTVFVVSCTAARGALTPFAVYVAKDGKGSGAKPVTFEGLKPDGTPDTLEMLYSVTPAREAFTKDGDPLPNQHTNKDTPWIVGAWAPDDRPGVCAVAAQWKLQGEKAELQLWEEARECPKGELPKYERKADKNPPPLVGR